VVKNKQIESSYSKSSLKNLVTVAPPTYLFGTIGHIGFPKSCHAPSIEHVDGTKFLVVWFQGSREGAPDVSIWSIEIDFLSKTRAVPKEIFKLENSAHWNPVLFKDQKGKIHIYFKVGEKIDSWVTWHATYNNGEWSAAEKIKSCFSRITGRGPVRSKPIFLSNGDWIAPSSIEETIEYLDTYYGKKPLSEWRAFVDRSINFGKSWKASSLIDFDREKFGHQPYDDSRKFGGIIQPTLWESSSGNVHMLLRSTACKIFRSDSLNYGKKWSPAYETSLPNNNSAIDIAKSEDGVLCMAYNPIAENWGPRTPLSVSFSFGEGTKWTKPINIASGDGSYSYPSIVPYGAGFVIVFSSNRLSIVLTYVSYGKNFIEEVKNDQ